ncbi:MAG: hypothetical protein KR126chlam6_00322 [Candidatus Anoxychlamydiales bacterium]|nr:hypothetical protein [Candidatus Anoxychlamydiales bacterium]
MDRKKYLDINYVYFGIFFVIGIIISTLSVLEIYDTSNYSRAFFLLYAYGQTILEVGIFAISAFLIKKYLPKIVFNIFIAFCFVFFISHIIDLVVLKIMDMTFWEGLDIALDESLENFIEMLHTTGIPFFAWIIFGILGLILPFFGLFIYKITDKLSKRKKIPLYREHFIQIFLCTPLALFIWDFKASSTIAPTIYDAYTRTLPWKITFVQPNILKTDNIVHLKKQDANEKQILATIDKKDLKIDKKPNIYIFVIESLRSDYITETTAPNITEFKKNNVSFKRALSNANNSHNSWFAFFYSNYTYFWKHYQDMNWQAGATSLYILKKLGYDINVFAAPELKYYSMKDALFGKDQNLCSMFKLYPHYYPTEACDSDIKVMNKMTKALKEDHNTYIAFLDSTHFLYSWPKDFETKFKPIVDIESLHTYASKDSIELIKNRYKNSIYFVDSLLGEFFKTLKEKNLYDDAIIIITGDHGEEFYEEGHLFHASNLSTQQTNVPLYFKFGKNERPVFDRDLVCHMDVFPSILDYLLAKNQLEDVLFGESVFEKSKFPFVISTRYNGSRAPFEFFIHDKDKKITFRFKNRKDIFQKQHLEILSLKDADDKPIEITSKQKTLKSFEKALDKFFER